VDGCAPASLLCGGLRQLEMCRLDNQPLFGKRASAPLFLREEQNGTRQRGRKLSIVLVKCCLSCCHGDGCHGYPPSSSQYTGQAIFYSSTPEGGGGTLGISGWGCAAGTLEALTYTRASSAEFCYPMLDPPYPRVAVFQKLLRSLAQSSQNKTLYHNP